MMLQLLFVTSFIVTASSQTFSVGGDLGSGPGDVIPNFESKRSPSTVTAEARSIFDNFFSISRVGNSRGSGKKSSDSQPVTPRNVRMQVTPELDIAKIPTPVRISPQSSIPSRGASSSLVRETASLPTQSMNDIHRITIQDRTTTAAPKDAITKDTVPSNPELSSRGRIQQIPVEEPDVNATKPEAVVDEVVNVRDNLVGQSVCPRGRVGDACREHLAITAMACTSGFCHECQKCGRVASELWPRCCREHFLCCRPVAKACQACDHPSLKPFCIAAFGRCH